MTTTFSYLPGAPISELGHRTASALAEDRVPPGCPHPAVAGLLYLHLRVLVCADCAAAMLTDPGPGECAACGAPDGCLWFNWFDVPARVVVTARVCPSCMKDGNVSLAAN